MEHKKFQLGGFNLIFIFYAVFVMTVFHASQDSDRLEMKMSSWYS